MASHVGRGSIEAAWGGGRRATHGAVSQGVGSERGMVTAELAVAISAAIVVMIMLCWGIFVLVLQLRLVDTAGAVARQAARGDTSATARARASAPAGAVVHVYRRGRSTVVTARLRADPFGPLMPSIGLTASAEVATEPGVGGR